ncbi:hypothetical protein [Deinococcus sp. 23YEL01]|uniref:hypothetical protein n=1 Tax=Deinococcus sp. 23YEL01 TaxID=2745871 RepID=UPI001E2AC667|nr:hypothetical protein [Deinococcus sp. 23YEL01]MCD0169279.1 hypothetical protein [Deinococcus sp. 23YEL01]
MKKLALAAIGLTGILASCGATVSFEGQPVSINGATYTSNYYYDSIENGQTKRNYVICNDRSTDLYLDLAWSGGLSQVAARFISTKNDGSSQTKVASTSVFNPIYDSRDRFTYTIGTGAVPLSLAKSSSSIAVQKLEAQRIIVTPATIGNVAVDVWGYNEFGYKGPELNIPGTIPIVASCN